MRTNRSILIKQRCGRESGFTLVEMMVAITIGVAMIAGLMTVLANTGTSTKTNDRTAELLTNGRYALNSLRRELRQAGYRGYTWADPSLPTTALGALTNECLESGATASQFISNMRQGIWGANNSNPFSANCIPDSDYATTGGGDDVLVIRSVADIPTTTLTANTVYFRSSYAMGEIFRGTAGPTFPGSQAPLADFALRTYVYYISPYSITATESPLVPALYRVSLQANGSMSKEMVASGIERFQVQYGVLTTAPDTRYFDSLAGSSVNVNSSDWDGVNSVRIWLLARNETPEPGYLNTNSYAMGDRTLTVNDNFRRQLFSTVVQLRN